MKNALGHGMNPVFPIGTVRIRTRHGRGSERRAYIKTADPSMWRLRAHVIWEDHYGPIPNGKSIHHLDHDTLNDDIANLEALSKAEHYAHHEPDFHERRIASFVVARRARRWSTKSPTKLTGRHPQSCACPLHST